MSKLQISIALASILLLFGLVGGLDMEDARKIEAMRLQLMEGK